MQPYVTRGKIWKEPERPSWDDWVKMTWCSASIPERDGPAARDSTGGPGAWCRERSQTEKDTRCTVLFICGIWGEIPQRLRNRLERLLPWLGG